MCEAQCAPQSTTNSQHKYLMLVVVLARVQHMVVNLLLRAHNAEHADTKLLLKCLT